MSVIFPFSLTGGCFFFVVFGVVFFFGNFFILIFYFTSWMGLQSEIYQSSSLHFLWVYVTNPALENQSSGRRGARACERREKPRNETQNQSFEFERLSRFIMPCFFFQHSFRIHTTPNLASLLGDSVVKRKRKSTPTSNIVCSKHSGISLTSS